MKRICVFCGSNSGFRPEYLNAARHLGKLLATRGVATVYGGANLGAMGALADAALQAGGEVIGVIPEHLVEKEIAHQGLTQLHIVDSMHTRKTLMADLSEGFIALPGGLGTCEEFFEVLTWAQLGMHTKPCGLLNVAGYFDHLLQFLNHAAADGMMQQEHRAMLLSDSSAVSLLAKFENYQAPTVGKWIGRP